MNTDFSSVLLVILIISISCAILSPVLCWVLSRRPELA